MKPVRILHLFSSFDLGGKEARAVRLMNHFGGKATHTVLSAVPDALGARDAIDRMIEVAFPGDAAPALPCLECGSCSRSQASRSGSRSSTHQRSPGRLFRPCRS